MNSAAERIKNLSRAKLASDSFGDDVDDSIGASIKPVPEDEDSPDTIYGTPEGGDVEDKPGRDEDNPEEEDGDPEDEDDLEEKEEEDNEEDDPEEEDDPDLSSALAGNLTLSDDVKAKKKSKGKNAPDYLSDPEYLQFLQYKAESQKARQIADEPKPTPKPAEIKQEPLIPEDFALNISVNDQDFEAITESNDKAVFQKVLSAAVTAGIKELAPRIAKSMATSAAAQEQKVLNSVSEVVEPVIDNKLNLQLAVKSFYRDNKHLKPHAQIVGMLSNVIASKRPDWSMEQVLDETAIQANKHFDKKRKTKRDRNNKSNASNSNNNQHVQPKNQSNRGTRRKNSKLTAGQELVNSVFGDEVLV